MEIRHFDLLIVGAGIAGASLAARLSPALSVGLFEMESQPGYHSTGRSAAIFSTTYGSAAVRTLSRASEAFLDNPPQGFSDSPLLRTCGVLMIARADQMERLDGFASLPDVAQATRTLTRTEAEGLLPVLAPCYVEGAIFEPAAAEIDVHALHQGFLKQVRAHGGTIATDARVTGLSRQADGWTVETTAGPVHATIVVNAAGAWADILAELAGAAPTGIEPRRRTAVMIDPPQGMAIERWPMTVDVDEQFYLKPDAGRILLSPADETLSEPCDAQPEEYDVAVAIDRVERATTLKVTQVRSKWAGLRCFSPDRNPVIGFDPDVPGFFWLAGQGGYGIQTASAIADLAAGLLTNGTVPSRLVDLGLDLDELSPRRFATAPSGDGMGSRQDPVNRGQA